MQKYSYSLFTKLIYRYGNIPLTLILSVYLALSIISITHGWYFIINAAINFSLIIILNKYYARTYRLFPSVIIVDNETITCSGYFFSDKTVTMNLHDIDKISGGIFTGWPTRPVYLFDSKHNVAIGFYAHVGNFNELLKWVLMNVEESIYNIMLEKMKKAKGIK